MIRRLIEDAELTESIGCAFAFDLGVELEMLRELHQVGADQAYANAADNVESALLANWAEAIKALEEKEKAERAK